MNVLHIEASPRPESHSRSVAQELVAAIQAAKPDATVVYRDLNNPVIPPVSNDWVQAATYGVMTGQAPTEAGKAALEVSDALIAELQAADVIVFAVPMYNFGLPSVAKAYVDQIVRVGVTVNYTATGPVGELKNKKMYAVVAYGGVGYGEGGERESINALDRAIKVNFGFLGVTDLTFLSVEGLLGSDEVVQSSRAKATAQIADIVAGL